jgi:hypothetical protein
MSASETSFVGPALQAAVGHLITFGPGTQDLRGDIECLYRGDNDDDEQRQVLVIGIPRLLPPCYPTADALIILLNYLECSSHRWMLGAQYSVPIEHGGSVRKGGLQPRTLP